MELKGRMKYVGVLRYENKNYCTEGLIKKNETERRRVEEGEERRRERREEEQKDDWKCKNKSW